MRYDVPHDHASSQATVFESVFYSLHMEGVEDGLKYRGLRRWWSCNSGIPIPPAFVSCDADLTEKYMYISMKFGTGVHVFCWEVGVFNLRPSNQLAVIHVNKCNKLVCTSLFGLQIKRNHVSRMKSSLLRRKSRQLKRSGSVTAITDHSKQWLLWVSAGILVFVEKKKPWQLQGLIEGKT